MTKYLPSLSLSFCRTKLPSISLQGWGGCLLIQVGRSCQKVRLCPLQATPGWLGSLTSSHGWCCAGDEWILGLCVPALALLARLSWPSWPASWPDISGHVPPSPLPARGSDAPGSFGYHQWLLPQEGEIRSLPLPVLARATEQSVNPSRLQSARAAGTDLRSTCVAGGRPGPWHA